MTLAHDLLGDGPELVLVHGITQSRGTWAPLVPALAAGHRVLAVDLPGHGDSPPGVDYQLRGLATAVHDAVVAAGFEQPLLVGHSLGAAVVTAFAADHRCRGVLAIDQPLRLGPLRDVLRSVADVLRGPEAGFAELMGQIFSGMNGPLPAAELARIESTSRLDQHVVLAIWTHLMDVTAEEMDALVERTTRGITAPYLALHGMDPGDGYEDWLGGRIAGAAVERWADHGHYPHLVDPARFLTRLAAFETTL